MKEQGLFSDDDLKPRLKHPVSNVAEIMQAVQVAKAKYGDDYIIAICEREGIIRGLKKDKK